MDKKMFLGLKNSYAYESVVSINSDNTLKGICYYRYEPFLLSNPSNMNDVKSYLWNTLDNSEIRAFCNKKYGDTYYKSMQDHFTDIMNDRATTAQEFLKDTGLFIDDLTIEYHDSLVLFKKRECSGSNGFEFNEDGNLIASLVDLLCTAYWNRTIPNLYLSLLDKAQSEMSDAMKNKWQEVIQSAVDLRNL